MYVGGVIGLIVIDVGFCIILNVIIVGWIGRVVRLVIVYIGFCFVLDVIIVSGCRCIGIEVSVF